MGFSYRTFLFGGALSLAAFLCAATPALAQQPQQPPQIPAAFDTSSASAAPAIPAATASSAADAAASSFDTAYYPFVPSATAATTTATATTAAAPASSIPLFPAPAASTTAAASAPAPQPAAPPRPAAKAPATTPGENLDLRVDDGIVAVVEDQPITIDDVRLEIAPLIPQLQREATSQQDFENKLTALQDDIIQNHIDRTLIVKDFYKEKDGEPKKSIPDSYIDNAMSEDIINKFDNDRSKFLAYLRAKGQTIRDYRKDITEDMIYGYMRSQQRKSASVVSPVQVQTFYNENKDKFYQDDQVHLRLIQFNRNGQTDDELRAQASEVLNRLKNGEKFEDIAKEVSQDTRRSKGGDWGWQKRTDLKPELSGPLFNLKKGEVTDPIIMPEGAFLMYVEDRKYAGIQPLDDVRDQIEQIILQQMARTTQEQWLERLRRDGYVKYYDTADDNGSTTAN